MDFEVCSDIINHRKKTLEVIYNLSLKYKMKLISCEVSSVCLKLMGTNLSQVLLVQELPDTNVFADVDPSTKFYLTVYGILAASNTVFTLMRAFLFAYGGICAARYIHRRLLDSVLYVSFHSAVYSYVHS